MILFSHLGAAGKAGLQALAAGNLNKGGGELALLGLSLAAAMVLVFLVPRLARRVLEKRTKITIIPEARS
jgi:hypothetical protein